MGRHSDPKRKDTNPFGQIFRDYEPAHTGFEGDPDQPPEHTVPPVERTDGGGSIEPYRPTPETEIIRIGAPPVKPFEPDPAPYPDEPGWTHDDPEPVESRTRARWPVAVGLSVALCATLAAGALGRATAPGEPVSDAYSPRTVVTVTLTPAPKVTAGPKRSGEGLAPVPTVTRWKTATPKPSVKVSMSPGPTVRVTQFVTPKPVVSVRISTVPVPGPTVTCMITITLNRSGIEVEPREESGAC